jgi:hypothetical protein
MFSPLIPIQHTPYNVHLLARERTLNLISLSALDAHLGGICGAMFVVPPE